MIATLCLWVSILACPVEGGCQLSQGYYQESHRAVDLVAAEGTPILAAEDGEVIQADWSLATYPPTLRIVVQHGLDSYTSYWHLSSLSVEVGDEVLRGQQIGLSGSTGVVTGPHLHFSVWRDGRPVNPEPFLWRWRECLYGSVVGFFGNGLSGSGDN